MNIFHITKHKLKGTSKTGSNRLAQVSGRNKLDWERRFILDVDYVNEVSFILDVYILLKTIQTVFKKEGISSKGSVTMDPFEGSN